MSFVNTVVQAAVGDSQKKSRREAIDDALALRGRGKNLPPSPAARLATQDEYHAEIRRVQDNNAEARERSVGAGNP